MWDSVDVALGATAVAALMAAGGVYRFALGRRSIDGGAAAAGAEVNALRAAIACLCFPPLIVIVSTGTTDVALGAMIALAIVLWRRPSASTAVIAAAGWFKLAPFALLPLWLAPLRGRRLAGAIAGVCAVSIASGGLVVAVGGLHGIDAMWSAIGYQFSRGSMHSAWYSLGAASLQPLAEAAVIAFVAGATVHLWRKPVLARDSRRMAALSAATLIGLQLSANYWAFLYFAWIAPLVVMSLLADRPRLPAGTPA
jgi:hypothetical protein